MLLRKLLTAAALTMALSAIAVLPTKTTNNGKISICPKEFGCEGKPSFFFCSEDEDAATFEQVNEDLEVVKTFSLPVKTYVQENKILIPSGYTKAYTYSEQASVAASSTAEAIAIVNQYFPSGFTTANVTTYVQDMGDVVTMILFFEGNKLPNGITNGMDNWEYNHWCDISHQYRETPYPDYAEYYDKTVRFYKNTEFESGELDWSTPVTTVLSSNTDEYVCKPFSYIYYSDSELTEDADLCITQTLFNSDDDYEVLVPIFAKNNNTIVKEVRESSYPLSYTFNGLTKYTYNWNVEYNLIEFKGIAAVNMRTGETVASFDLPEPYMMGQYWNEIDTPYYFKLGEKIYLVCSIYSENEDNNLYYFFAIEKGMSGAQAPVMTKSVKIHPSVVNRGEDVMVNVDGNDAISAITLTGMNGQTLQHIKGNGAKSAAVKTGRLGSGVHIVGVQTTDGENTYNKIVVK